MTTVYEWPKRTSKTKHLLNAAQRLRRVFNIDLETCNECGGAVKVIASIEDPVVIKKILTHWKQKIAPAGLDLLPPCRAPPQTGWFEESHHSNERLL